MQKYANNTQDIYGNVVPSASVSVYTNGTTTLATIYSDNGITTTANPITTDSSGEFSFYAADGRYDLSITKSGVPTVTLDDIQLFDPHASTGSAYVSFTPSGTATKSSTVSQRLGLSKNIMDYIDQSYWSQIENFSYSTLTSSIVTAAFNNAITDLLTTNGVVTNTTGALLRVPYGLYILDGISITLPIRIRGENPGDRGAGSNGVPVGGSILRLSSSATSPLLTFNRNATYRNYEQRLWGIELEDLCLDGNARAVAQPAIKASYLDHFNFSRISIFDFAAQAINFNTSCREGWITDVHTRFCGDIASSLPDIDLRENSTDDAHNLLKFTNCFFVYSLGNTIQGDSFSGSTTIPRQIDFIGCVAHGVVSSIDGSPYTLTAAQKNLQHMLLGNVGRIGSIGSRWFVGGDAVATIEAQSTATSLVLDMVGGEVSAHYASTGSYDGIKVAAGTLISTGVYYTGNNKPINATGGTVVERGNVYASNAADPVTNNTRSENVYLDSTAEAWDFRSPNGSGASASRLTIGSGSAPELRAKVPMRFPTVLGNPVNYSAGGILGWDSTNKQLKIIDDSTGPNVARELLSSKGTQTTVGAAGAASALPANPTGYVKVAIGATTFVIPYYAAA